MGGLLWGCLSAALASPTGGGGVGGGLRQREQEDPFSNKPQLQSAPEQPASKGGLSARRREKKVNVFERTRLKTDPVLSPT